MKSHSASKKRFSKNCKGRIKRSKAYNRHHAWAKSPKQGRNLRGQTFLNPADEKNVAILLPY